MAERILVVEDDSLIREVLEMALRGEGYVVDTAGDGISAVEYLSTETPDLVVLDLALPLIDGFQVCQVIRRQSATASVPVLVVSALASASAIQSAYRAGADVYLDKPFDLSEFLANVETLLQSRARAHAPREGGQHYRVSSPVRD
jgi:DNA-binding response OmpR family regulator